MAADDGGASIVYTLVMAILVGGAVQSAIAIWLWERLCPKRSTLPTYATAPTQGEACRLCEQPFHPGRCLAPCQRTEECEGRCMRREDHLASLVCDCMKHRDMLMTRTVSTQSQTTYKWWWDQPRFVPLPEHSHGVGLVDPFWNPGRR